MNSHLTVNETLALLDKLKGTVHDFAAREEKLNSEFRTATNAELNALAARNQARENAAANLEIKADDAWESEKSRLQARFEKREARIERTQAAMGRWVQGEISERDSEWKDHTRQEVQAAEVRRDEALAAAAAAYESFQQNLAEAGGVTEQLQTAILSAFGGYGRFRRLLVPDQQWPEPDLAPDENKLFAEIGLPPLSVDNDRVMMCGSPSMLADLGGILKSRGFVEGNHSTPGHYVIEKAFVEK